MEITPQPERHLRGITNVDRYDLVTQGDDVGVKIRALRKNLSQTRKVGENKLRNGLGTACSLPVPAIRARCAGRVPDSYST